MGSLIFDKSQIIKKTLLKKKFEILGSAHNLKEVKIKEKQGVDAVFLASLFNQKKTYLGIERFKILKNQTKLKTIALGGLNQNNIKKLKLLNVFGFAAISFFKKTKKNGPYINTGRLNFLV